MVTELVEVCVKIFIIIENGHYFNFDCSLNNFTKTISFD